MAGYDGRLTQWLPVRLLVEAAPKNAALPRPIFRKPQPAGRSWR